MRLTCLLFIAGLFERFFTVRGFPTLAPEQVVIGFTDEASVVERVVMQ